MSRYPKAAVLVMATLAVFAPVSPAHAWSSQFTITRVDSAVPGVMLPGRLVQSPSGALVATDGVLGHVPADWIEGTPFTARMFIPSAAGWNRRASEPPIDISFEHALVMDRTDHVHVLSWQNAVSDSSRPLLQDETDAGWTAEVLDTGATTAVGLALDSHDELWATYLRVHRFNCCWGTPFELIVAHRTASGWARDSLPVPFAPATYSPYPFAIDDEGHPHLLFVGADYHGLFHATRTESGWQTTTIDAATILAYPPSGGYDETAPQLAVAADGAPHALYRVGPTLWHARMIAGAWVRDSLEIPSRAGSSAYSLALDRAGRPRVAYLAAPDIMHDYVGRIIYAYDHGGGWNYVPVVRDPDWQYFVYDMTLILDASDTPSIYFAGPEHGQLSVATFVQTLAVGPSRTPARLALALVSGNPPSPGMPMLWGVSLPKAATVTLEVFDLAGRRVAGSGPRSAPEGESIIPWTPEANGPGGYFVRASALGEHSRAVHMLVRH
jgi:hypothetical protein